MRAVYLISMLLLMEGCSIKEVKPWGEGNFSKRYSKAKYGKLSIY